VVTGGFMFVDWRALLEKSSSNSISKSGNDLFATKSAAIPPSSGFCSTSRDAKLLVQVSLALWRLP
jgi:hypothetical protein